MRISDWSSDVCSSDLSRAQSVMQYLGEHGVAADRMTAVGRGETQPIADNDSDEGRELNRRVELRITGAAAQVNGSASVEPVADSAATMPDDDASAVLDDMSTVPTDPQSFDSLTGP